MQWLLKNLVDIHLRPIILCLHSLTVDELSWGFDAVKFVPQIHSRWLQQCLEYPPSPQSLSGQVPSLCPPQTHTKTQKCERISNCEQQDTETCYTSVGNKVITPFPIKHTLFYSWSIQRKLAQKKIKILKKTNAISYVNFHNDN